MTETTTNPQNPLCVLHFPLVITSKFLYFQHEVRCSEHLENYSVWVLSWWIEFSCWPLIEFWRHILSGCQGCDWGIQYQVYSTYRGLWELVVVQLSWLSSRALVAQARDVLGSTAGLFTFLCFHPITSKFLSFQHKARCSEQRTCSIHVKHS